MSTDIPPGLPLATVSVLDIFAKVVEMQVQLAAINEKLSDLPDHEARIRVLESAKARLYGGAGTLGALFGGGAGWLIVALGHH